MIYLIFAILSTVSAQLFFKVYTLKRKTTLLALTIFFFGITPILSYKALQSFSLDVVYLATAINVLLVSVLAHFVLKEEITKKQIIYGLLILSGIVVYNI